ncbi:MAG: ARMT1-like domain-containing protein [Sulfuricurvum sp.]|nr:ARMT1-like domain-containing protein [Sulfuricurvum sp.]
MTIQNECIECISAQSRRVCQAIHANEALTHQIINYVETSLKDADFTLSPPVIAAPLYEKMAELAAMEDLYKEQKEHATQQAISYIPFLKETIANCNDPYLATLKTAVVGNVIDLAAEVSFDLHEAIISVFDMPFHLNDTDTLRKKLLTTHHLLYIGDNAGEHVFDMLTIESLQTLFPHLTITYMVRGNPIINDVTMDEALEANMQSICTLIDSGVPTPGFVYELASPEAQQLFDTADLIIAKGMGNYECMTPQRRDNICFLLKVKCSVVAASLNREIGDIVCKLS